MVTSAGHNTLVRRLNKLGYNNWLLRDCCAVLAVYELRTVATVLCSNRTRDCYASVAFLNCSVSALGWNERIDFACAVGQECACTTFHLWNTGEALAVVDAYFWTLTFSYDGAADTVDECCTLTAVLFSESTNDRAALTAWGLEYVRTGTGGHVADAKAVTIDSVSAAANIAHANPVYFSGICAADK
jgi:hypothetical protein